MATRGHADDVGAGGACDIVDCTVFAPSVVPPSNKIVFVQLFVHLPAEAAEARALATEFDANTERRGFKTLEVLVDRGNQLGFELWMPGLHVNDPLQTLVWRGSPAAVQFSVAIPANFAPRDVIGSVTVSLGTVPIGHIKFKLTVADTEAGAARKLEPTGEAAVRYRRAFVSYASDDRQEVLKRVQMLPVAGIESFQDVLDLDPGTRWEQELYRKIDECDLFLLFWSRAAKRSEWVRLEARYALDRQRGDEIAPPVIKPVPIEGPPIEPAWEELSHLHHSQKILYFFASGDA